MGVCASCLGGRKKDVVDEVCLLSHPPAFGYELNTGPAFLQDEESPLFMDDGNNLHYGSFDDPHLSGQDDPVEVQRENEALLRVVARTSE